jgi:prepilin-type N-terminal cleavage/methylation domain-containing protein
MLRRGTSGQKGSRGFTLIELLIVIAIILILIAIALPNFLEAQTRARVASARGGLRAIQYGFEAYYTDFGEYVTSHRFSFLNAASPPNIDGSDMRLLSTPIPYIKDELPRDPFTNKDPSGPGFDNPESFFVAYGAWRGADGTTKYADSGPGPFGLAPVRFDSWMGWSAGPDNVAQTGGYRPEQVVDFNGQKGLLVYSPFYDGVKYSATNGTKSLGDLYVFGPGAVRTYQRLR